MQDPRYQGLIIWLCLMAVWLILLFYLFTRYIRWLVGTRPTRYEVSRTAMKVSVMWGRVTLLHIPRSRIREAVIVGPLDLRLLNPRILYLRGDPFSQVVLIETDGLLWYALSPEDPAAMLRELGFPNRDK